jgi:nucleotide-binding universal stress UspA family protein
MAYDINTILYATDLGPHGPKVFSHAAGIAQKFGAKVHVIHTVEPMTDYAQSLIDTYVPTNVLETLRQEGFEGALAEMRRRLELFCKDKLHTDTDQVVADMRVVEGLPAQVILSEAKRIDAQMIVLGSHGQSALGEIFMGSVAHKVIMHSKIPVLLIPIKHD